MTVVEPHIYLARIAIVASYLQRTVFAFQCFYLPTLALPLLNGLRPCIFSFCIFFVCRFYIGFLEIVYSVSFDGRTEQHLVQIIIIHIDILFHVYIVKVYFQCFYHTQQTFQEGDVTLTFLFLLFVRRTD